MHFPWLPCFPRPPPEEDIPLIRNEQTQGAEEKVYAENEMNTAIERIGR